MHPPVTPSLFPSIAHVPKTSPTGGGAVAAATTAGPTNASAGGPMLIGAAAVAELLSLSPRTVFTLTKTGKLPHLRIGRRVLYPVEQIRTWAATQTRGGADRG